MIRLLLYLLVAILMITVLRSVIGVAMKLAAKWLGTTASPTVRDPQGGSVPTAGVLKRDPVCGTFVSEAISIKVKTESGMLHFCSEECRAKYEKTSAAARG